VKSYFGEVVIPVIGEANAIPGFRSLELSLAGRNDRYRDEFQGVDGVKANTSNPKVGINWEPIDGLKLRATYGTSFRVPTISQEYGNSAQVNGGQFVDWNPNPSLEVAPGASLLYPGLLGPNPAIRPEKATTKTFGFDYQPSFARNVRMSATYFDIDYKLQIVNGLSAGATRIDSAANEAFWAGTGIINRNPSDALLNSLMTFRPDGSPEAPITGAFALNAVTPCYGIQPGARSPVGGFTSLTCNNWFSGTAVFMDNRYTNLGLTRASGINFQVQWSSDDTRFGRFGAGASGVYYLRFDDAPNENAPLVDTLSTPFHSVRVKTRGQVSWSSGGYAAVVYVNYQSSGTNAVAPFHIPSWTTFDTRLSYRFADSDSSLTRGLALSLSVTNVFNSDPPFVNIAYCGAGCGGTDPVNSDPIGRLFTFSVEKKF
jgi:iron complex outermembrane receptor protein